MSLAGALFKETFVVDALDASGARYFDGLSRLELSSAESPDVHARVDVATELYSVHKGNTLTMILADQLTEDGSDPTPEFYEQNKIGLAMCGTVFKFSREEATPGIVVVYVSFGGLILELSAPFERVSNLAMDRRVFALFSRPNE